MKVNYGNTLTGEKAGGYDPRTFVGKILLFSIPLIASGILQQSFNAIDVAVIGHYSTTQAIAAVGSNGPIISILVNLFLGVAVGPMP